MLFFPPLSTATWLLVLGVVDGTGGGCLLLCSSFSLERVSDLKGPSETALFVLQCRIINNPRDHVTFSFIPRVSTQ